MKNIVVALDFSEVSNQVLEQALQVTESLGGQITLVHAVGMPVDLPSDVYYRPVDQLLPVVIERAQKSLLEKASVTKNSEIVKEVKVDVGTPWQVICDIAKEKKADLIVIGSHGYNFLDRLLGTTVSRVVNHAPCSVWVVRVDAKK